MFFNQFHIFLPLDPAPAYQPAIIDFSFVICNHYFIFVLHRIPLERQIPVNRQTTGAGSGSGSGCDFEPWTQVISLYLYLCGGCIWLLFVLVCLNVLHSLALWTCVCAGGLCFSSFDKYFPAGVQRHSDLVRLRILQRLHLLVWKLLSWPGNIFAVTKYCGIKPIKQFTWLMLTLMNIDYCLDQVTSLTWDNDALLIPTYSKI